MLGVWGAGIVPGPTYGEAYSYAIEQSGKLPAHLYSYYNLAFRKTPREFVPYGTMRPSHSGRRARRHRPVIAAPEAGKANPIRRIHVCAVLDGCWT